MDHDGLDTVAPTTTAALQVAAMMDGVDIDGVRVTPEEISVLDGGVRLRVVVAEGKKHEVRECVRLGAHVCV